MCDRVRFPLEHHWPTTNGNYSLYPPAWGSRHLLKRYESLRSPIKILHVAAACLRGYNYETSKWTPDGPFLASCMESDTGTKALTVEANRKRENLVFSKIPK